MTNRGGAVTIGNEAVQAVGGYEPAAGLERVVPPDGHETPRKAALRCR
jgi:hypothetical protein